MIVLRFLVFAYILCFLGMIVLSWFPLAPDGVGRKVFEVLRRVTEPVLAPLRRLVPPVGGVVDLSPMIVLFILFALLGILK